MDIGLRKKEMDWKLHCHVTSQSIEFICWDQCAMRVIAHTLDVLTVFHYTTVSSLDVIAKFTL